MAVLPGTMVTYERPGRVSTSTPSVDAAPAQDSNMRLATLWRLARTWVTSSTRKVKGG